ncbi:MAG: NAD(P)-binding domain-containing protein [Opitutales bacterium]
MAKRLAIIGAGSSGLATLKYAIDELKGWDIVCYEKTDTHRGCWGDPYTGFVSTSTKYATQFACFQRFELSDRVDQKGQSDYFKGDEYGEYLDAFVREFGLAQNIRYRAYVESVENRGGSWSLMVVDADGSRAKEDFDAMIICTGLASRPRSIDSEIPSVRDLDELSEIQGKTVVVLGGGESAVEAADRLADESRSNRVYLSLRSGVRVSPRYHPIRGVPSDFLRNRLMLSISLKWRNAIGQKFVEARMRFPKLMAKLFPGRSTEELDLAEKRKAWDLRLTYAAKDRLFNIFHTKSDRFLDRVATVSLVYT